MDKILKDIEENLPKIQELSFDIFEDTDTESAGSARMLYNLLYLYQDKYGDEAFTSGKLKTAQDIKEDAAEKLAACRENISAAAGKKAVFKSQTELSGKIESLLGLFGEYQKGLYLYAFSSYLTTLFAGDFSEEAVAAAAADLQEKDKAYTSLFTESFIQLRADADETGWSKIISGVAAVSKKAGEALKKVPIISDTLVDEALSSAGDKLDKYNEDKNSGAAAALSGSRPTAVGLFADRISVLKA